MKSKIHWGHLFNFIYAQYLLILCAFSDNAFMTIRLFLHNMHDILKTLYIKVQLDRFKKLGHY